MRTFLYSFFGSLVAILLILIIFFTFLFVGIPQLVSETNLLTDQPEQLNKNSILYIHFDQPIIDRVTENNFQHFSPFSSYSLGLNKILSSIRRAKEDENIVGIYLNTSDINAGMATTQEIREILLDFKESGKFIISSSDYYSQKAYYLASVADKIYLTSGGYIDFRGLSVQIMFMKNMFAKIGISPQIIRHGKFKAAIEPLVNTKMSKENKLQTEKYIRSIWEYMLKEISDSRNIPIAKLKNIADELMSSNSSSAMKLNLIDSLKYKDEVLYELKQICGIKGEEKLEMININRYEQISRVKKEETNNKIAVIYASGVINLDNNNTNEINAQQLAQTFRQIRKEKDIKAIVFRINSPGGSALASEVIWREAYLTAKKMPFIVSMGDMAASGGYYIACIADTIVANPLTITGSIGVFGVLLNGQELLKDKLGIDVDGYKTNKHSDFNVITSTGPFYRPINQAEKDIMQREVDSVYNTFILHVGAGRELSKKYVDKIGQGRVWSGINAKEIKLIDKFGGLITAVKIAKEKADIDNYSIESYPKQENFFDSFILNMYNSTKEKLLLKELEENYHLYKSIKEIKKIEGVQALMPYKVDIQ